MTVTQPSTQASLTHGHKEFFEQEMLQYSRETLISLLLQHPSARYWRIDQFQRQRHIQAVVLLAMLSLSGIHVQIACDEVPKKSLKRDSYRINPKYFKTQTICKKKSYYTCSIQYNGAFAPGLQPMLSFLPPSILIFSYFLPHILASCLAFGFFFPCFLASSLACLLAGRLACSSLLACSRGAPNWKTILRKIYRQNINELV